MATERPADPAPSVRQELTGDHNIVVGYGNVTIQHVQAPESSLERRALEVLRERVEQFWIKGVLEGSVHGEALLDLGKEELSGVVEHPWEKVLELPGQAARRLPQGSTIGAVFQEVERFLLILGEPGAGKTTTLLELARDLLARARSDATHPIPVVFSLSTWATGKKPFADWLADELKSKYFVSRPTAQAWLAAGRLLPLLDGLDEVAGDSQEACVEALNAFIAEGGLPGLSVCSRTAEYLRLPVRLKLNGAIRLLPLTPEQVADYFRASGPRLAALAAALRGDSGLQELARTPLMLSVMTLAYQDLPLAALAERRESADVFTTYVDRMFERKGKGAQPYSKAATVTWLIRLARGMLRGNQTLFLVEQLEPAWLTTRAQRWAYVFSSRLLMGAALGLGAMCVAFLTPALVLYGLLQGIGATLLDGWRFKRSSRPSKRGMGWWLVSLHVTAAMAIPFVVGFVAGPDWQVSNGDAPFAAEVFALFWGLLFGLRARRDLAQEIRTVETLTWSWRQAWKRGLLCATAGLALSLPVLGVCSLDTTNTRGGALALQLLLICGPLTTIGALLGAMYGGLGYGIVAEKTLPNQGIALSVRNSGLAGLAIMAFLGTLLFLLFTLLNKGAPEAEQCRLALGAGVFFGLLAALWFGGMDVLAHLALRLVLWRSGEAPHNYPRFLDHAARLIFLQKVGGGYIFVHRLLLEHFAALDTSDDGKAEAA